MSGGAALSEVVIKAAANPQKTATAVHSKPIRKEQQHFRFAPGDRRRDCQVERLRVITVAEGEMLG